MMGRTAFFDEAKHFWVQLPVALAKGVYFLSQLKNPGPEDQDLGHPWKGYALPCSLRKQGATRKHLLARFYEHSSALKTIALTTQRARFVSYILHAVLDTKGIPYPQKYETIHALCF